MKIKLYLILTFIILVSGAYAQPVVYDWSKSMGGINSNEGIIDLARDNSGNVYVIGEFSGNRDFSCSFLTAVGSPNIYVAKFNQSGACQWAISGGASFSSANSGKIAVNNNNVYITGYYFGNFTLDGITVNTIGNYDIFIASINATTGSANWVKKAGGALDDYGIGISACSSGGAYICGNFRGTATFDAINIASSNANDADLFYAKYDDSGNCVWAKRAGGTNNTETAYDIKEVSANKIVMAGSYDLTATFGPGMTYTSTGYEDIFLLAADANGTPLWASVGGSNNTDVAYGLSSDPNGNVYISGVIYTNATFGSVTVTNSQLLNVLVAKFNGSGVCQWAVTAGSGSDDIAYDISTDAGGSSYVTGYINGNATFGTTSVTGVQLNDGFVAKYNLNGGVTWVSKIGGSDYDQGKGVVVDVTGHCFATGYYTGNMSIGTTSHSASGFFGTYLTRLGGGTVGLNEAEQNFFSFYPNPAQNNVRLNFNNINDLIFTVDLLSVDGKLLHTYTLNQEMASKGLDIDLQGFARGTYLFRVNTSQGEFTRKFVAGF